MANWGAKIATHLQSRSGNASDPAVDPVLKVMPSPPAGRSRLSVLPLLYVLRRPILFGVIPAVAVIAAISAYLAGGRYITTDNAYVGAQKVLITPDISGKIIRAVVTEGQHVEAGDTLFEIDPVPFRLAVTQAEGKVAAARVEYDNLKTNLKSVHDLALLAREIADVRQRDTERKNSLLTNRSGSAFDADAAMAAYAAAKTQVEQYAQQEAQIRNQLLGDPALPLEKYPAYAQATAALDQAKRDLDHANVRAPIAGTATQVDSIQLGRYASAGTPILSIIDDGHPWVEANPKETDITFLKVGQKAAINIDTFSNYTLTGTVIAVSPGTGAQFAILPPQNASGNWVKIVQRVSVRIRFDEGQDLKDLRSGMSSTVSIDTGRKRTIASVFAATPAVRER
jgi:membrane fusion protein (multidrug efflux system)